MAAPAISLGTPLARVRGVGPATAAALAEMGLTNVGRLVAHIPARYDRLEAEGPIGELSADRLAAARGEVTAARVVARGRRPRFEAVLMDGTGRLDLVWFNMVHLQRTIHAGTRLRVQGRTRSFHGGLQMANPSVEVLDEAGAAPAPAAGGLRPVYPATASIDTRRIERAVGLVLDAALPQIDDHLPGAFRRDRALPDLSAAYRMVHRPGSDEEAAAGRRRLAYDELLLLQLGVHLKRAHLRRACRAPALRWSPEIDRHIRRRLPFTLTASQDRVVSEITRDLTTATPMNRLLQGDVGSGKTAVAVYAMLLAAASGRQAALMAPTELLAEQHAASIRSLLAASRVRVGLVTGQAPRAERAETLARLAAGEPDLVIGTHALLSEGVRFGSLAVAVIDEQHRFGVHQRARLRAAADDAPGADVPHVLVMTATPIPRTMALTLFGNLDISVIDRPPAGRKPVRTRLVAPAKRDEVYAFVRQRIDRGEQAYVVVPAIGVEADEPPIAAEPTGPVPPPGHAAPARGEEPEADASSVRELVRRLEARELSGRAVAAIHGRLKRSTRDAIMEKFRQGRIDALVATTVVEVGVDVPNATVMVVEHADRFGLSQLHQLRGRVGRGSKASVCVLIADPATPEAAERLRAIVATSDGFALAERDLEIRGPADIFGSRQSGAASLRVADLARDLDLLKLARRDAARWIEESPALDRSEDALARRRVLKQHGVFLGLGDVG